MQLLSTANIIVLVVYFVGMVAVGAWFSRRQKTTEDFFLAGRRMPWLPVAMSMYASVTSATTYLVLPGKGYKSNISMIVAGVVSVCVAPVLIYVFYRVYRRMRVTTSYEYIGKRFGLAARRTASSLFVLNRLAWLGLVVYAPALVLSIATELPLEFSILLVGLLAMSYTALGGLSAVLWTDVVQFVVLVVGAVWVLVSLLNGVDGGAPAIMAEAEKAGRLDVFSLEFSLANATVWSAGLYFLVNMLSEYGTDQVTVQRLMAVKRDSGVVKAICFNAVADLLLIGTLLFIGLGLHAFYLGHPDPVSQPDQVLPFYVINELPAGVSGLVVAAIFAAAMSSLDSGLNSLTTSIMSDFRSTPQGDETDAGRLDKARKLTVLLGLVAINLGFFATRFENILDAFTTYMSLFAAPTLAMFLLGMTMRRGRFAGWIVGACVAIPAVLWIQAYTNVNWSYHVPFSFAVTYGVGVIVSMVLPRQGAGRDGGSASV